MDIRTFFNDTKFDVRACGILMCDDQLLVSHEPDGSLTLSGGAMKIGESSEQAVIREFFEETNLHVEIKQLVAVIENFFQLDTTPYQQIIFVYKVALKAGVQQKLKCKEKLTVQWENIEQITNLKPDILNDIIKGDHNKIDYYIHRE